MSVVEILQNESWEAVCTSDELIPNSGICALVQGHQVALFYIPDASPSVFALSNWDPIGKANVISRGMVGSIGKELVVASPLYKQHFSLSSGACLEQPEHALNSYSAKIVDGNVHVLVTS